MNKDLVEAILKAAKEVHSTLGDGFLEQVYEEALYTELGMQGIKSERQFRIDIHYKGALLNAKYIPDLLVEGIVPVEIKTVKDLTTIDETQITNYLKVGNMPVGILLNFGKELAAKKRMLKVEGPPTEGQPASQEQLKENNPETL